MVDTRRLLSALQTLHADNAIGDVSAQDNRDFLVSTYPDFENVKNHGAKGDGTTDDSAAIQAAIDAAPVTFERHSNVFFPPGDYLCAELDLERHTSLIGVRTSNTRLYYNGDGAAGSQIIKLTGTTGSSPGQFISHMSLIGWHPSDLYGIAEYGIRVTGTPTAVGIDHSLSMDNLHISGVWGNAIDFLLTGVNNLHINRSRFDVIGGYWIAIKGTAFTENRPISINQFTGDNLIRTAAFGTKAQAQGVYDGTHWCKGALFAEDPHGYFISFNNGRVEQGQQMVTVNGRRSLFYVDQTISGKGSIHLDNVVGFFQKPDSGVVVYAPSGRMDFSCQNAHWDSAPALFEDGLAGITIPARQRSHVIYHTSLTNAKGVSIEEKQTEIRAAVPSSGVFNNYKRADEVHETDIVIGGRTGWLVTDADDLHRSSDGSVLSNLANVTSSNAVITILDATKMDLFWVNKAIKIEGAGVASADLDTFVTDVDPDNVTITVDTTPSTTINPADITYLTPTFTPTGIVGGVQASSRADSVAADLAALIVDFNDLLAKMRTANLLAS